MVFDHLFKILFWKIGLRILLLLSLKELWVQLDFFYERFLICELFICILIKVESHVLSVFILIINSRKRLMFDRFDVGQICVYFAFNVVVLYDSAFKSSFGVFFCFILQRSLRRFKLIFILRIPSEQCLKGGFLVRRANNKGIIMCMGALTIASITRWLGLVMNPFLQFVAERMMWDVRHGWKF